MRLSTGDAARVRTVHANSCLFPSRYGESPMGWKAARPTRLATEESRVSRCADTFRQASREAACAGSGGCLSPPVPSQRNDRKHWWEYLDVTECALQEAAPLSRWPSPPASCRPATTAPSRIAAQPRTPTRLRRVQGARSAWHQAESKQAEPEPLRRPGCTIVRWRRRSPGHIGKDDRSGAREWDGRAGITRTRRRQSRRSARPRPTP
jgi:hypothetical protein